MPDPREDRRRDSAGVRRRFALARCRALAVTVACAAMAAGVGAQSQSAAPTDQPTAPVTRHGVPVPNESLSMGVSVSGTTSEDQNIGPFAAPRPAADLDTLLAYHRRGKRIVFDLGGQSSVRRIDETVNPMRQQGQFDLTATGQHQQFHSSQSVSYAPSYQFGGPAAGTGAPELDAPLSHGDLANADVWGLGLNSNVEWNRTLSPRTTMAASYNVSRTTFERDELDLTTQEIGGRVAHRLTQSLSLQTGYAYRIANSGLTPGESMRLHDINAEIDFSRQAKGVRATTFSFRTGTTLVPGIQAQVQWTGDASITRQIGQTWKARGGVNRNVRLVEGFVEPVLENSLNGGLSGNLQRRLSVFVAGSLSNGNVGVTPGLANGYESWTATSGTSFMLARSLVLDAAYFWVGNRFEPGVVLPPEVERRLRRRGLRVELAWRFPLFRN
jgi:hypothetical protein